MFKRILVAIDNGDTYQALFQQALALAQATQANLMLLNVMTPEGAGDLTMPLYVGVGHYPLNPRENLWEDYTKRYREYEAASLQQLQALTETASSSDIPTEFTQATGSPGPTICKLAETWEADLILVGSHGRRGISELLLGSVSNYVVHHAACSVMVVHRNSLASEASPTLTAAVA